MLWLTLSLAAAFCMATNAAILKKWFSDVNPWEMGVIPFFYATPLCLAALLMTDIPPLQSGFYPTMAWLLPVTGIAFLLHFRAVYLSPLSLTMPFLSFTPVFVILTGDLMLGEHLSKPGIYGILLVVAGGYILNLDSVRHGVFGPIRAIFREPGSALMLLVAAMYGITSVGGKVLIINSSPLFGPLLLFTAFGPVFLLVLLAFRKVALRNITRRPLLGMLVGLVLFCDVLSHNLAISMVNAAYMVTLKRLAGIFSVIYGRLLFGDRGLLFRLAGTATMTAGAAIIVLLG